MHSGVLDHFAARRCAFFALFGTLLHVLVVGKLSACLAALVTGLGTRLADRGRESAMPSGNVRCEGTNIPAIDAQFLGLVVFLLSTCYEFFAMVVTALALKLAVCTCLGAFIVVSATMLVMVVLVIRVRIGCGEGSQSSNGSP